MKKAVGFKIHPRLFALSYVLIISLAHPKQTGTKKIIPVIDVIGIR
jgi:hypothetical protein